MIVDSFFSYFILGDKNENDSARITFFWLYYCD